MFGILSICLASAVVLHVDKVLAASDSPSCDFHSDLNVTNCADLNLTSIPKGISNFTVHLELQRNLVSTLRANAFPPLAKLFRANLEFNQIEEIEPNAFSNLPALAQLRLSNNQIFSLADVFSDGPTTLTKLDLSYNRITKIGRSDFAKLVALKTLDLSWNRISTFDKMAFVHLTTLKLLHLQHNELSSINVDLNSTKLVPVNLGGNPWKCDCPAKFNLSKSFDPTTVVCQTPKKMRNKTLEQVRSMTNCTAAKSSAARVTDAVSNAARAVSNVTHMNTSAAGAGSASNATTKRPSKKDVTTSPKGTPTPTEQPTPTTSTRGKKTTAKKPTSTAKASSTAIAPAKNSKATTASGKPSAPPTATTTPGSTPKKASPNPKASTTPGKASPNPKATNTPGKASPNPKATTTPGKASPNPKATTTPDKATPTPSAGVSPSAKATTRSGTTTKPAHFPKIKLFNVTYGRPVKVECEGRVRNGSEKLNVTWKKDTKDVRTKSGAVYMDKQITIRKASKDNMGTYCCYDGSPQALYCQKLALKARKASTSPAVYAAVVILVVIAVCGISVILYRKYRSGSLERYGLLNERTNFRSENGDGLAQDDDYL